VTWRWTHRLLSVAIAEAPASYAFFLGSGVSRYAGVPTGGEVFWRAVGELYRLETASGETPDQKALSQWLTDTGREQVGYSDVLELIAPDAASRRDYLAKHFEGVQPGPTHERLADLASRGLVKVLVTTNFDRLLERALQARGIEPVVVTSESDLTVAPAREHARCYVLKPHGDYLQDTIRNTPAELATLDPSMTAELREVFDRYGIVVLGYSGSDPAIADAMRRRRVRYGLYWVARGELVEPARSLVEVVAGRITTRAGAAEFLADLDRRLTVFSAHPSGQTPLAVHDETVLLLRRGDTVGLHELLLAEQRALEAAVVEATRDRHRQTPTTASGQELHGLLLPVLERRLASLCPLVLHDAGALTAVVRQLVDFKQRKPLVQNTYVLWTEVPDWCCWWLGQALGAFAARQRRFAPLQPLLTAQVNDEYGRSSPLVPGFPGDMGLELGNVLNAGRNPGFVAPYWEPIKLELPTLALLSERYPELVAGDGEPERALVEFNFVQCVALGLRNERIGAVWTMYSRHGERFAARLHADAGLRADVAEACGLGLEEFDRRAPQALRSVHHLTAGFSADLHAVALLETGQRG
jgi:hypothetical protein